MTATPTSTATAAARTSPEPHRALANWLAARVRTHDRQTIGQLLRNDPRTQGWQRATAFAADPRHRQAYGATAWLFALYHQGIHTLDERFLYGSGDVGRALRRLGPPHNRGPKNTGCYRLYERLVTHGPLPLTALDQAVSWMRSQGRIPPSFSQLAHDLTAWPDPQRPVQHAWAHSFFIAKTTR
ncbi:type I-E CRISPR-associated protein Cse2/CasB [Streptomyces syringium]|uniref:type I-E CRISPR-associated protein Cse2/CasB n=1 Tax=Streptomyces syringium TaxID=76729 RepID=UPI0034345771